MCACYASLAAASLAFFAHHSRRAGLAATQAAAVVTVTRDVGRSPLDLPYAITTLRPDSLSTRASRIRFVEQTLALLPGVTVANRTNPSQDTRVSIRGFGARSQFGARSIRILRDGMPLTLPDGQTPIDYLDLESVGRVEVIRGSRRSALWQRRRRRDRSSFGRSATGAVRRPSCARGPATRTPVRGAIAAAVRRTVRRHAGRRRTRATSAARRATAIAPIAHQQLTNAFAARVRPMSARRRSRLIGLGSTCRVAAESRRVDAGAGRRAPEQADRAIGAKKARKSRASGAARPVGRRTVCDDGELIGAGVWRHARALTIRSRSRSSASTGDRAGRARGSRFRWHVVGLDNRVSVGADAQWLNDARKNWANCNGVATANASCPALPQRERHVSRSISASSCRASGRMCATRSRSAAARDRRRARRSGSLRAAGPLSRATAATIRASRTLHAVSPMLGLAMRLSRRCIRSTRTSARRSRRRRRRSSAIRRTAAPD